MTKERETLFLLREPSLEVLNRLSLSDNPFDTAIFELWRGRSVVSSVTAARLTREQADALLLALHEVGWDVGR